MFGIKKAKCELAAANRAVDAGRAAVADAQAAITAAAANRYRVAELEAMLRRIDAVIAWETTPLGRGFQDELDAALLVAGAPTESDSVHRTPRDAS